MDMYVWFTKEQTSKSENECGFCALINLEKKKKRNAGCICILRQDFDIISDFQ